MVGSINFFGTLLPISMSVGNNQFLITERNQNYIKTLYRSVFWLILLIMILTVREKLPREPTILLLCTCCKQPIATTIVCFVWHFCLLELHILLRLLMRTRCATKLLLQMIFVIFWLYFETLVFVPDRWCIKMLQHVYNMPCDIYVWDSISERFGDTIASKCQ